MTNDKKELLKKTASNRIRCNANLIRTWHPSSSFNFLIYFFASRKPDDGKNIRASNKMKRSGSEQARRRRQYTCWRTMLRRQRSCQPTGGGQVQWQVAAVHAPNKKRKSPRTLRRAGEVQSRTSFGGDS
ncbi:MAG TPA: hypothetical protein VGO51_13260 [Burkholderiaceae bacterium]|nr:hypothetical protein [Burkholderiaceae bacterium]